MAYKIKCLASGTIAQNDIRFAINQRNAQCVPISVCAICASRFVDRRRFTGNLIDDIVIEGDAYYTRTKQLLGPEHTYALLNADEVAEQLDFQGVTYRVEKLWIHSGAYPLTDSLLENSVQELRGQLQPLLRGNDEDGYVFTGLSYAVAFWKCGNSYRLFNSHAIGTDGRFSETAGVARLFECANVASLARLLLINAVCDGVHRQYEITQIRISRVTDVSGHQGGTTSTDFAFKRPMPRKRQESISSSSTSVGTFVTETDSESTGKIQRKRGRPKKQRTSSPIQTKKVDEIAEWLSQVEFNGCEQPATREKRPADETDTDSNASSGTKRGRPKKKRGRPKSSTLTRQEQVRVATKRHAEKRPEAHKEAVARYSQKHPETNREAVSRYNQEHPEVHREAMSRYTQEHPEVHRSAVSTYASKRPEVSRESSRKYRQEHADELRTARNVPINLRRRGLIAYFSGESLESVQRYALKKESLYADDIYTCQQCNTHLFEEEKTRAMWCCGKGAYTVPEFPPLTASFYDAPAFQRSARAYNNLFAMSALGVSHGFQHPKQGVTFLKIQGRTYHRVFDLSYRETTNPIGLYIDDAEERLRLASGLKLNEDITKQIDAYLKQVNPYIDDFKRLSEEPSDEAHLVYEPTTRRTHGNVLGDVPTGREVAGIISTDRERFVPKKIVIWKKGASKPHTVDIFHQLYETLQYPLLYPHGTPGWYPGITGRNDRKMSQLKYHRRLVLAEPRFSEFGRLSQEWIVDAYCRISEERLRYIQRTQQQSRQGATRVAPLQELIDVTVQRDINHDETIQGAGGTSAGKVYLPSTFCGSPRYMKVRYLDGMAIVNRCGKPTYFMTITLNPRCSPILLSTPRGRQASPSLSDRVFQLILAEIMRDIKAGSWFGQLDYVLHVIEYQKRGLPHAHVCFRVEGGGPTQTDEIDAVLRADIPSPDEAGGRLRKLVLTHMIHGPCGHGHRKDLPCWDREKSKCTKRFPKPPCDVTYVDDRGFVHLKRDENNRATICHRGRDVDVSDLWVVPYNAALLLKYECHINLEIASTRKIVKYIFKYVTKGPDEARVAVVPDAIKYDEIEQYVTKRYIGACEAAWRVLEFDTIGREPNVAVLPVHLPNKNFVVFKKGREQEAIDRAATKLQLYFARPIGDEFDGLTYVEFYERYLVHASRPRSRNATVYELRDGRHFATRRQKGRVICRLQWLAPNLGELFYLRILLNKFPARSYEDFVRLGGPDSTTFQETARAVGLADDDVEYERAMAEAQTFMTGPGLRNFFVVLLLDGAPGAILWEAFKRSLCEDLFERYPDNEERAFTAGLIAIDRRLRKHGRQLSDFGMEDVGDSSTELGRERVEYSHTRLTAFVDEWLPRLSADQKTVYDHMMQLVATCERGIERAVFVDGPAGTGKTLLLNVITAKLRADGLVVLCTASSGIAAQNHENGTTAHSMFRLPIDVKDDTLYWNMTNRTQRAELIRAASLIIYDESPMAHKVTVQILERSLRDLMDCDEPFGGKNIVFAGDFRQTCPVVVDARSPADVVAASIRCSYLWDKLQKFHLHQTQRTRDDEEYSKFLLRIGNGEVPEVEFGEDDKRKELLVGLPHVQHVLTVQDLIDFVFPRDVLDDPDACAKRAILTVFNVNVKELNEEVMKSLPQEETVLSSVDFVDAANADELLLDVTALQNANANGVPGHELRLKIGALCMIMRNLNFGEGLVNGTKVIVVAITARVVTVRKPNETVNHMIPRIMFKFPFADDCPIEVSRRQFPLQVCYAMTVHKSQGQTIDIVGCDFRSSPFSHGLLYVALGRVRNSRHIRILVDESHVRDGVPYVQNVIYRDLLN